MTASGWVELILAILLILNLIVLGGTAAVAMRKISKLTDRLDTAIAEIQRDAVTALQDTHTALGKVAELTGSLEEIMKHEVAPTLGVTRSALTHIDTTLKGAADATSSVRRIAAGAEALTAPGAMSEALSNMMGRPGGRSALLAGIALTVIKTIAMMKRRRRTTTVTEVAQPK